MTTSAEMATSEVVAAPPRSLNLFRMGNESELRLFHGDNIQMNILLSLNSSFEIDEVSPGVKRECDLIDDTLESIAILTGHQLKAGFTSDEVIKGYRFSSKNKEDSQYIELYTTVKLILFSSKQIFLLTNHGYTQCLNMLNKLTTKGTNLKKKTQ